MRAWTCRSSMDGPMARMAKGQAVTRLVAQIGAARPRFYVVGIQRAPALATMAAGIIVPLENILPPLLVRLPLHQPRSGIVEAARPSVARRSRLMLLAATMRTVLTPSALDTRLLGKKHRAAVQARAFLLQAWRTFLMLHGARTRAIGAGAPREFRLEDRERLAASGADLRNRRDRTLVRTGTRAEAPMPSRDMGRLGAERRAAYLAPALNAGGCILIRHRNQSFR